MIYKVTGKVLIEREVEADSEDEALAQASDIYNDEMFGISEWYELLDWTAEPKLENK